MTARLIKRIYNGISRKKKVTVKIHLYGSNPLLLCWRGLCVPVMLGAVWTDLEKSNK